MVVSVSKTLRRRTSNRVVCFLGAAAALLLLLFRPFPYHLSPDSKTKHRIPTLSQRQFASGRQKSAVSDATGTQLWNDVGCRSATPLLLCRRLEGNSAAIAMPDEHVFSNTRLLAGKSRSCALVGSSGRLLNRTYGDDIDRHDIVIRLNDAPIHPYEKYVGKRPPDITFVNRAVSLVRKCLENTNNRSLIVQCYYEEGFGETMRSCASRAPVFAISKHIFYTAKAILTEYKRKYRAKTNTSPTAGMYAVIFSMHLCSRVDIYGFGAVPGELYAYYRDIRTVSTHHSFDLEHQFLMDASNNLVSPILAWLGCESVQLHN
ncbi:uncharacterized protein LOC134187508 [Corticium candelabrum]|uniref:uncharacterized protein LOC134187508 n=1 Tax=Corticium candelabrum TaxID=121492 RepID=UPI002E2658DE|nr:uncharacterized protein LOC134187508 [Corticium candelabrum]